MKRKGRRSSGMRHGAGAIFARVRIGPGQLRSVAARRFDDAEYLLQSRRNKHANGAMYLAGFVVECLLKARLLEKHAWLETAGYQRPKKGDNRRLWSLAYRSHDLDEILARLPEVWERMATAEQRGGTRLQQMLKRICAEWTIFARYSPRTAAASEANAFVSEVKELRRWLA
jgi:hypothetical protein